MYDSSDWSLHMQVVMFMCDYPHCPKPATIHVDASWYPLGVGQQRSFDACDEHTMLLLTGKATGPS